MRQAKIHRKTNETDIRIAFSAVEESDLENLFATLATAARELRGK